MFDCVTCGCKRDKLQTCGHCGEWRCPICTTEEITEEGLVRVCVRCKAARALHIRATADDKLCGTCGWPRAKHKCSRDGCGMGPKTVPKTSD